MNHINKDNMCSSSHKHKPATLHWLDNAVLHSKPRSVTVYMNIKISKYSRQDIIFFNFF